MVTTLWCFDAIEIAGIHLQWWLIFELDFSPKKSQRGTKRYFDSVHQSGKGMSLEEHQSMKFLFVERGWVVICPNFQNVLPTHSCMYFVPTPIHWCRSAWECRARLPSQRQNIKPLPDQMTLWTRRNTTLQLLENLNFFPWILKMNNLGRFRTIRAK